MPGLPAVCASIVLLCGATAMPVARGETAVPATDFLNSIGANSAIASRGESVDKTIECAQFLGLRWLRAGIEGDMPVQTFIDLHKQAGVRFCWGLGSGGSDIPRLIETARQIESAGALLAFEGPNEPNNWGITYEGEGSPPGCPWRSSKATSIRP